jgi:Protein of unknown function (DUF1553)/Protein of unknown function (DUF1549)/Concanavalin A-like lectin/glucanases superfamily/Planctomycete cytochrome C
MIQRGLLALLFLPFLFPGTRAAEVLPRVVEFNRDIRPFLSDACFQCHGPDKARRKADLRLDNEDGAFADLGGHKALVAGRPDQSELFRRITAVEDDKRMPPKKHGPRLTPAQVDLFRRWIEQGAKWQKHWAFLPPIRANLPAVKNTKWVRNGIDAFVLERLEREGLAPAAEAERTTLLRRVTLDLTGLPPTPAEVDAFLADLSADAYEKVVDRLLASPRYAERMAIRWLNAARYADTSGYQSDGERIMWRWRDWVLDAYQRNMPFDQFTIEQVAGDLLPNATLAQKIATGFHRNHRGNAEGGIIPEEYAVEYVADRVETTSTVWLGLTVGCARCHDHKFDPVKQKEFYQLFAYFNNVPERGRAIKIGNSPPMILSPTPAQEKELAQLDAQRAASKKRFNKDVEAQIDAAMEEWEKGLAKAAAGLQWFPTRHLGAHFPFHGDLSETVKHGQPARMVDGAPAFFARSPLGQAVDLDGKKFVDAGNVGDFGFQDRFTLSAWIFPREGKGTILSRMTDVDQGDGYALRLAAGKVQLNLVKRWLDDAMHVETQRPLTLNQWHHVAMTYDGSRYASGVRIYVDGKPEKLTPLLDELNQTFTTKQPLRIGAGGGPANRFHGLISDVRVYNDYLPADDVRSLAVAESVSSLAAIPQEKRTSPQNIKLLECFLDQYAPEAIRGLWRELRELEEKRARLLDGFPTTMVMEEMPTPRESFVLIRGEYDKRGAKVAPGVPAVLSPLPPNIGRNNRLALARWLVDPANPLTARVAVNRFWQMYFGTGLVKTVDDFGSQGEPPSHPELLDFLAVEFMRTGWDVKAMQKRIVTSATYRQSSRASRDLLQRDPDNRLLARGPRLRLSAEMIRDQALFVSGLLVEKVGGPSVRPYQPVGLEKELGADPYIQDRGENLYRRSLYTFWKRTLAPPAMINFDAPGREMCMVRESRTNTPLQALNLLNDVTFVEASRMLAQRVLKEAEPTQDARLRLLFRLVTARPPRSAELAVLRSALEHHRKAYQQDPHAARKLLQVGEAPRDEKLDGSELAAFTMLASMILNLDETITKE